MHHANALNQPQIVAHWESLTSAQQASLSEQIDAIDLNLLSRLREVMAKEVEKDPDVSPLKNTKAAGSDEARAKGEELLAEGKVGCLIMAGGMGTRLQFDGPKGMFPITIGRNKTLFEFFADRIRAASKKYGRDLPVAIMTSSLNDTATRNFFLEHNHLGLRHDQLSFFQQGNLPFLDQRGDLFLDAPGSIAQGPDGNGDTLRYFFASGIWENWQQQGVECVNVILIDNPLADPFDAELIGTLHVQKCDLCVKALKRESPKEKLGVLVRIKDQVHVIEYSEMTPEDMEATVEGGALKYPCGNISLFAVSMNFVERVSQLELPLHKAFKALPFLDQEGSLVKPVEPNGWKFEKFIFDTFPFATVEVVLYPRHHCFAPLKNKSGHDSPDEVRRALLDYDRSVYRSLSGLEPPDRPFELDPAFYYPTDELKQKWQGRALPEETYIEP